MSDSYIKKLIASYIEDDCTIREWNFDKEIVDYNEGKEEVTEIVNIKIVVTRKEKLAGRDAEVTFRGEEISANAND
jgi:hypothetical protein